MIKRKECTVEGCKYSRFAKGFCSFHQYLRKDKVKKSLSSRQRINPVSVKRSRQLREYRNIRDGFLKGKICEFPKCVSKEVECHHAKGRVGNLLTDVRYFKALCRKHHRFVEDNPAEARKLGLSYNRLEE